MQSKSLSNDTTANNPQAGPPWNRAHWQDFGTRLVNLTEISEVDRLIPPTQERIAVIAASLKEHGQIHPIQITFHGRRDYRLVTGATRLRAAAELGWKSINASIVTADNEFEYRLLEIAENMDRHDLAPDERAKLEAAQKEERAKRIAYFEELVKEQHPANDRADHKPKRKHVATGKAKTGRPKGGTSDAARKAGIPKSTAHRLVSSQNDSGTKVALLNISNAKLKAMPAEELKQHILTCQRYAADVSKSDNHFSEQEWKRVEHMKELLAQKKKTEAALLKSADEEFDEEAAYERDLNPRDTYKAYRLRVDQAVAMAEVGYKDEITTEIVALARRAAEAWSKLADEMEARRDPSRTKH